MIRAIIIGDNATGYIVIQFFLYRITSKKLARKPHILYTWT